ncbi:hypothetical protein COOONC_12668 [Cooperia oncophora]
MKEHYKKKPATESLINYTPYEYGSIMHYAARYYDCDVFEITPSDPSYLRTMGSPILSFYDIVMVNRHYNCDGCKHSNLQLNVNTPTRLCAQMEEFQIPENAMYAFAHTATAARLCDELPEGCGEILEASLDWKSKTFTFDDFDVGRDREHIFCNYWIEVSHISSLQRA